MKYKPSQYAEGLYEILKEKRPEEHKEVLKKFYTVLQKNGDSGMIDIILTRYEKLYLQKEGLRKVTVQSASPLSSELKKEIEQNIGSKILYTETVKPELLAGLTILLDDSVFIDASGRTRIDNLFK